MELHPGIPPVVGEGTSSKEEDQIMTVYIVRDGIYLEEIFSTQQKAEDYIKQAYNGNLTWEKWEVS